jgi:DNA invertase Pin-like site-specific DNA recombinase
MSDIELVGFKSSDDFESWRFVRMKVAIYCRVSTDSQELLQQVSACVKFCEFKGFDYEIFQEVGSGKDFKREQFQVLLPRLRARLYDGVVLFRFDRIGRNAREVVMLFEELESKGVEVFSINENIDTSTAIGRAIRDIIMRLAQLERENISEATSHRLQALKSLGRVLGRPKGSKDKKERKRAGYLLRYANKGRSKIVQDSLMINQGK